METVTLKTDDGKEFHVGRGQGLAHRDDGKGGTKFEVVDIREDRMEYTPSEEMKKLLNDQAEAARSGALALENVGKAIMDLAQKQRQSKQHDTFMDPGMDSMEARDYADLIESPATNDWARAVHMAHDALYVRWQTLAAVRMAKRQGVPVITSLREYKRWAHVMMSGAWRVTDKDIERITRESFMPLVTRAATWDPNTTGAGAEFAPIGVSRTLIGLHRLASDVVGFFPQVEIPRGVKQLDIPTLTSSAVIRVVAANTGTTAFPPQSSAVINSPATAVLSLVPKKHGSDILAANVEEIEDATIAVVEALSSEAFTAMGKARENALINGQSTGDATFDIGNGPLPSNGYATSVTVGIGLRKYGKTTAALQYDALGGDMTLADFQSAWEKMGNMGVNDGLNSVGFIASAAIWYDLIKDPALSSVAIAGPIATLPRGALMPIYGIPVFASSECPNVKSTGVIGDGTSLNSTFGLFVNRNRWRTGVARDVELRILEPALEDVLQMRTFARHCVGYAPPITDPSVVLVINVDKAP